MNADRKIEKRNLRVEGASKTGSHHASATQRQVRRASKRGARTTATRDCCEYHRTGGSWCIDCGPETHEDTP